MTPIDSNDRDLRLMQGWRVSHVDDRSTVIALCAALYAEDPSEVPLREGAMAHTLDAFAAEPLRGVVLVLQLAEQLAGYAVLASFWSNELGGETCELDELYVVPAHRSQGHAALLLDQLAQAPCALWPGSPVALGLQVTPDNERARALYQRNGFRDSKNRLMLRRIPR